MNPDPRGWSWSKNIDINAIQETSFLINSADNHHDKQIFKVSVRMKDSSIFVIFDSENPDEDNIQHMIRNKTTNIEFKIWQVGADKE